MPMALHGRMLSPFTRRVAATFHALDLPFESRPLSTATDLEALRAVNPALRVPALVLEDGTLMVDSFVMVDYADNLVTPDRRLIPLYEPDRHRVQIIAAWANAVMEKGVASIYERMRRPAEKVHQPWAEHLDAQVAESLRMLERHAAAASGGFLFGGRLTQADIASVVAVEFLQKAAPQLIPGDLPALTAYVTNAGRLAPFRATAPD